ncbi:hypothetical protein [Paenibacillus oceani]|uniref:Uncharacterized protein n=1 Tax=Paenibacillus oceani TaxID=2772510 RepID=A0A927CDC3_9BACL|nr:hypothetical protein [Paenibacillus oceani]MBD2864747.1 hypothetical protein [Paenibacillus oceani]
MGTDVPKIMGKIDVEKTAKSGLVKTAAGTMRDNKIEHFRLAVVDQHGADLSDKIRFIL